MKPTPTALPLRTKLLFSAGDLSASTPLAILMFFQLYFLTDVAGLRPDYAGWSVGHSRIWDAVNDPLIGLISDHIRTRRGRRRTLLLFGAVPTVLLALAVVFALKYFITLASHEDTLRQLGEIESGAQSPASN